MAWVHCCLGVIVVVAVFVLKVQATTLGQQSSIDFCLETDSISCLQLEVYKLAKYTFGIINGMTRGKKSGAEQQIIKSNKVLSRQEALADYFGGELKHFWNRRGSLIGQSPKETVRNLIASMPSSARNKIENFFQIVAEDEQEYGEGRSSSGARKKDDKKDETTPSKYLVPLLIGLKLKLTALASVAYVTIAVIAKKAILVGVVSMLLTGYVAVKRLIYESQNVFTPPPPPPPSYYSTVSWEPVAVSSWHNNQDHQKPEVVADEIQVIPSIPH